MAMSQQTIMSYPEVKESGGHVYHIGETFRRGETVYEVRGFRIYRGCGFLHILNYNVGQEGYIIP